MFGSSIPFLFKRIFCQALSDPAQLTPFVAKRVQERLKLKDPTYPHCGPRELPEIMRKARVKYSKEAFLKRSEDKNILPAWLGRIDGKAFLSIFKDYEERAEWEK